MEVPNTTAERLLWAASESAKELAEANGTIFAKAALSHRNALMRMKARGVPVETIIDIGAAKGAWSQMARTVWPSVRCHMIEANHHWEKDLHALSLDPTMSYVIAAAGPTKGEGRFMFSDTDPFGGVGATTDSAKTTRVPQISLDSEVADSALKPPFLVKFDTHGFEREIFAGADETFRNTSAIVIEAYNFGAREKRFAAILDTLEDKGFRCVDIGEPMWREHDRCFWQMDFFLVRDDRPEIAHNGYR